MTNETDELRRMLDERGVEYETNDSMGASETTWSGFTVYQLTPTAKLIMHLTPEQAIAATLGGENTGVYDALDLLDEIHYEDRISYDDYSRLFDAIATLSGEKLTAEQVRKAIFRCGVWDEHNAVISVSRTDMQAIADELNAALYGADCDIDGEAQLKWLKGDA